MVYARGSFVSYPVQSHAAPTRPPTSVLHLHRRPSCSSSPHGPLYFHVTSPTAIDIWACAIDSLTEPPVSGSDLPAYLQEGQLEQQTECKEMDMDMKICSACMHKFVRDVYVQQPSAYRPRKLGRAGLSRRSVGGVKPMTTLAALVSGLGHCKGIHWRLLGGVALVPRDDTYRLATCDGWESEAVHGGRQQLNEGRVR